jgi:hypothetical protein
VGKAPHAQSTSGLLHFRCAASSSQVKAKICNILAKAGATADHIEY